MAAPAEKMRHAWRLARAIRARARPAWRSSAVIHERVLFTLREATRRPGVYGYRLRDGEARVLLRHRSDDCLALAEVLGAEFYAPPEPVRRVVAENGTSPLVVDLGAHLGFFALRVLAHWPDARIIAWEPEPEHALILRRCIAANGRQDHWSVVEACAATADGQLPFRAALGVASHVADDSATATTTVPARDAFPDLRDAALVKMDIEGSEWALLADERFAAIRPPAMLLEWHGFRNAPADPLAVVTERLESLGYTLLHRPMDRWGAGMLWAWRA